MRNTFFKLAMMASLVIAPWVKAHANYSHKKLSDNVHILTKHWKTMNLGFGVVVGKDGLLLINSMVAYDVKNFEAELEKISPLPVKYVINSNYDGNNTQLNKHFADKGATIISHKALKYRDVYTQMLIGDEFSMYFGGQNIRTIKSEGHSYGQINILLEEANVLFTADSFRHDWLTYLGPKGLNGHINGLQKTLNFIDENTVIVPGGTYKSEQLFNKEHFVEQIQYSHALKSLVTELVNQGLTPEKIAQHKQITSFFKTHFPNRAFNPIHRIRAITHFIQTTPYELNKHDKSALLGFYNTQQGHIFELIPQGETIIARSENHFIFSLKAISQNTLRLLDGEEGETFQIVRNEMGKITALKPELNDSWKSKYIGEQAWIKSNK
ncbi:hypothetical protein L1077_25990 [Pseudoalteromonas luteoviolacea]|uniref:hypothetical protein n=1 Tax=Pseudoalteromonas luteoviolacea TaxID=43657 RepID=UPI001F1BC496|nr:hypothetical protein [Pseudoalteromonas luteoviolacea]MCF6442879.1 hypothetical protein [Pseudoalteromonas luteoviolacea]